MIPTTAITSAALEVPSVALAVGAHPDDVEFQAGATLARWAAAGCQVHLLVCTDGSKGTWDPDTDVPTLVATRQEEQRAAAKALGATGEVVFLGHVDGELEADLPLRREVAGWIRALRPDVLLGHDPWRRYRLHPDHRAAGFAVVDGVVAARDPHFYRDLGPHHRPDWLLLFEADEADHAEEATGFGTAKVVALEAHASQHESTMFISADDAGEERERFRRHVADGLAAGGRLATEAGFAMAEAELFRRLPLDR